MEGTNYDKVINIVNNELERIKIWLRANKLSVNIKKTHYKVFHCTIIKHKRHNIKICGMNVTYARNTKLLGVIIDNKLRWSDHNTCIKKQNR